MDVCYNRFLAKPKFFIKTGKVWNKIQYETRSEGKNFNFFFDSMQPTLNNVLSWYGGRKKPKQYILRSSRCVGQVHRASRQ